MNIREQLFKIICVVVIIIALIISWEFGLFWGIAFIVSCAVLLGLGTIVAHKVDQGIRWLFGS